MKKIILLLCTIALGATMHAGTVRTTTIFRPDDQQDDRDDMFDLDHHYAYTWGITNAVSGTGLNTYSGLKNQLKVGTGWQVESVTITFKDIWDWVVEPNDRLWVNLLDTEYDSGHSGKDLKKGITSLVDNQDDVESIDPGKNYFNNKGTLIGYWTDPKGGSDGAFKSNVTFTFSATQVSKLVTYINNGGATSSSSGNYADFGFAFDPDCHYYNTGIEVKVVTKRYYVPDGGLSVAFLGLGLFALAGIRRFLRR